MTTNERDVVVTTERTIPQVGATRRGNKWGLLLGAALIVVLALALGAQSVMKAISGRNSGGAKHEAVAKSVLPNLTDSAFQHAAAPLPAPQAPGPQQPIQVPPQRTELTADEKAALQLAERRRKSTMIVTSSAAGHEPTTSSGPTFGGNGVELGSQKSSSLSDALVATRATGTSASMLRDPNMMVTQGMFLDCVLQTAINSTLPGMTACELTRNVYSTNGRVLMLERGSRLVGQYQSNQLKQGQKRIFVLWTRAETPAGVIINLDSPSTDAVGRSGMDGEVDIHFWERFGAAMLVSLVDDFGQYEANKSNGSGSTSVSYGNTIGSTQNAASIIVQNTINIPPTLDKAQGSHINIFVARDLYFGNVYELTATR